MDRKGTNQLVKAKKVIAKLYELSPACKLPPFNLAMMMRYNPRFRRTVSDSAEVTTLSDETMELVIDLIEFVRDLPEVPTEYEVIE